MPQTSEFAKLIDLAVSQGVPHSTLLSNIHDRILDRYQTMYPDKPQSVEVMVNEKNGQVKLLFNNEDITPAEFRPLAEKIARETAIDAISSSPAPGQFSAQAPAPSAEKKPKKESKFIQAIAQFLFWVYNSFYIVLILILIFNLITQETYRVDFFETIQEWGNFRLAIYSLTASIPILSVASAVWQQKTKKQKFNAAKMLFLFEIPSIVLGLILASIFANPSPAISFFIIVLLSIIPIIYLNLTNQKPKEKTSVGILFFFQQTFMTTLIYISLLYSFILPPLITALMGPGLRLDFFDPVKILFTVLIGGIYLLIVVFLLLLPFIAAFLAYKSYLKLRTYVTQHWNYNFTSGLTFASLTIFALIFIGVSYQPNYDYYIDKLVQISEVNSFEQRQEIAQEMLAEEGKVRRILDDAQNIQQRYLFAKDDDFLKRDYERELGLDPGLAELIQETFEVLAYPFVYQGSRSKTHQARTNFKYLFGEDRDQYKPPTRTNRVTVDSRKVEVVTDYEKMLATISIDETYSNSSFREEEVIYEFFIDGTTVMHDLKLGPDLEFEGIVAPSGAARRLYDQEVRRTKDPALLEQLGPKQYRLSVFPVPGKNDMTTLDGKSQRVKFSYTVALTPEGYPLPQYSKEDNVKSVENFSLVVDGEQISTNKNEKVAVNDEIEAAAVKLCQADTQIQTRTNLGIGTGYLTTAANCDKPEEQNLFSGINGKKIAILQDVSYQNRNNRQDKQLLDYFKQNEALLANNQFDLYQYNDLLSGSKTLLSGNYQELFDAVYFGSSNLNSILEELKLDYDLIFLLSGAENYQITISEHQLLSPVYIVHTQEVLPYNSSLAAALWHVGGNVFSSWTAAKQQAGIKLAAETLDGNRQLLKNDRFFKFELDQSTAQFSNELQAIMAQDADPADEVILRLDIELITNPADPLSYLIAQGYIEQQYQKLGSSIPELADLDILQELSKQAGIVSPYSSYIALVNQRQLDDLERFSDDDRRFEDQTAALRTGWGAPVPPPGGFVGMESPMLDAADMRVSAPATGGLDSFAFSAPSRGFGSGISNYLVVFIGANILLIAVGAIYLGSKKIIKTRLKKRKSKK